MPELHCFFAVTSGSIYRTSDDKDDQGCPIVTKIATKIGAAFSTRLRNGSHVGIAGKSGIILYRPINDEERGPEMLNTAAWGNHTTPIVGLFLEEKRARECFATPDLKVNDVRFHEESARVLEAIGYDHPVFVISGLHYNNSTLPATE